MRGGAPAWRRLVGLLLSEAGRAEPVRKVSYHLMVPGRSWGVGAGVYDETTPIEEFEAVTGAAR